MTTLSASLANASPSGFSLNMLIAADSSGVSNATLTFTSNFKVSAAVGATFVSCTLVTNTTTYAIVISNVTVAANTSATIVATCTGPQMIPNNFQLNSVPVFPPASTTVITAFDPWLSVVSNMIGRFGGPGQLIKRPANNSYNPSTGKVVNVPISYSVKIIAFDFLQKKDGDSAMTNTLIKSGDKQIYMQFDSTVPTPVAHVDELVYAGNTFEIITVKQLNPSGSNVVYTEMYIRGG